MLYTCGERFHMLWADDTEVVPQRCLGEFQPQAGSSGKRAGGYRLPVLVDVEFIRAAGFVLVVNDAGTCVVILCQLIGKDKLVALGGAVSRGNHQTVIGINKDNVTAV